MRVEFGSMIEDEGDWKEAAAEGEEEGGRDVVGEREADADGAEEGAEIGAVEGEEEGAGRMARGVYEGAAGVGAREEEEREA